MKIAYCCIVVFAFLSGCSFAPEYKRPTMELPEVWTLPVKEGLPASVQWWKRFNDPTLDEFIQEALKNNKDILIAATRLDYVRAQLGITRADFFPQLFGNAQLAPAWVDHKKVIDGGGAAPYYANFSASWEIDLWGKIRNARDAALYQLLSTDAAQRGVILSVTAETAKGYFLLQSLDIQVKVAERTIKTREDALVIYTAQYKQGLINKLDYTRAKTEVESAKTTLFQTRALREKAETALTVLLGRSPRLIMEYTVSNGVALNKLSVAPVVPEGIPSELLERRPDILQAEYLLKAANVNIGVARAAWFPSISLTGLLGIVSTHLDKLFKNPLSMWSYGVNGTVPIIDFGKVYYNVEAAQAKEQEALFTYEKTVENAFKDIRDALTMQEESANIVGSLERMVQELRIATGLARTRYENGYSSYLEVLDAERALFQSELNLASAWSDRLSSIVSVCLALGGSWEKQEAKIEQ